ncbi:UDP-glucose/GDP-mannose dehydrogenase family protein, partial [Marivirga sp. S37H4]
IGTDTRIGKRFLFAGIGYGGSCFPKDVQALAKSSRDVNYDFKILESVMEVNQRQKTRLIDHLNGYFKNDLKGKTIAMWGLAFKPYTDDIREAPALYNIEALLKLGATVRVYDPEAMENVEEILGDKVTYCEDEYTTLDGADALMIMTEWPVFRTPEFKLLKEKLSHPLILDGRNLYEPEQMKQEGFTYFSIGR